MSVTSATLRVVNERHIMCHKYHASHYVSCMSMTLRVVDEHETGAGDARALRVVDADAQHAGDGGVDA